MTRKIELPAKTTTVPAPRSRRVCPWRWKQQEAEGFHLVVIMAPDEVARRAVQLKDLRAGDQHELGRDEVYARARELVRGG